MVQFAAVDAPAPERPLINLLGAARTPGAGGRWQEGTQYESEACPHVWTADTCDPETVSEVLTGVGPDDPAGRLVQGVAVYAVTDYDCIALPNVVDLYRDRVLAAADAELPRAVEHELWTGAIASASALPSRWLASPETTDLNAAGAVSVNRAVGMLEEAVGDVFSGIALLHVPRGVVPYLGHTVRNGRVIETRTGNRAVPGVGYPGTSPTGAAPAAGEAWLYATPMVTVRVGETEVLDRVTVDPGTNRARIMARTPFEVTWDGCTPAFAVRALLA